MKTSKIEFILGFFQLLNKNDITHCVLRNYENLPEQAGNDIDILIDGRENHKEIKETLIYQIESLGWKQKCMHDNDSFFTLICYKIEQDNVETLKLDIWTDLCWRGISWIDTSSVLENRRKVNGFYVPEKSSEAAITSLKEIIGGGKVPEKYRSKIILYANDHPERISAILAESLGELSKNITEMLVSGSFDSLDKVGKKIKKRLLVQNLKVYTLNTFNRFISYIIRFFNSPGKLITFIGPDGSGKTTIIELEEEYLKDFFPKVVKYHIRFNIFPELRTGLGFSSMKGKLNNEEEMNKPHNSTIKRTTLSKLASWFVFIYYSIEFFIGRLILKAHRINNSIVLFDRYYYDFFAQPTTRDLVKKYKKVLINVAKIPDVVIHLDANPNVVYERKQELSIAEIENQNNYLRATITNQKKAYSISTNIKTEKEIASEIFRIIVDNI